LIWPALVDASDRPLVAGIIGAPMVWSAMNPITRIIGSPKGFDPTA
jgi:hypothetical protein